MFKSTEMVRLVNVGGGSNMLLSMFHRSASRYLYVLLLALLSACGGGSGGSGDGASFVKSLGGDKDLRASAMLPLSDGYLWVGRSRLPEAWENSNTLTLGLLDANGDPRGEALSSLPADSFGRYSRITPTLNGWLDTALDFNAARNSYRLALSQYQVTGSSSTVLWRNQQEQNLNSSTWNGHQVVQLNDVRLLGVKARSSGNGWTGVLVLTYEKAVVDVAVGDGALQREAHSRLLMWRFNGEGAFQSVKQLHEYSSPADNQTPYTSTSRWGIGADGAYALHIEIGSGLVDQNFRVDANDGLLWNDSEAGTPFSNMIVNADDTVWVDFIGQLEQANSSGNVQVLSTPGPDLVAQDNYNMDSFEVACNEVGANGYCIVVGFEDEGQGFANQGGELMLWDSDGAVLGHHDLSADLPVGEGDNKFRMYDVALWPDGDIRVIIARSDGEQFLVSINPASGDASLTDLAPLGFDAENWAYLTDSSLYASKNNLVVSQIRDSQLDPILEEANFVHADNASVDAVSIGNDESLVLMRDLSIARLERDQVVEWIPGNTEQRLLDFPQLRALAERQGYVLYDNFNGWSAHNLDGSLRWSARFEWQAQGSNNVGYAGWSAVAPKDVLELEDGDFLLVGETRNTLYEANKYYLVVSRIGSNGELRWNHVYDLQHATSNEVQPTRATLLEDGSLLVVIANDQSVTASDPYNPVSAAPFQLLKIDSENGTPLLSRELRPATGGYVWNLGYEKNIELITTAQGKVWLGFTSYALAWRETVTGYNDVRVPLAYGENNLALIRLDEQLLPDRLRVYGAAGNESLLNLTALEDGGLLVSAETDSTGLGTSMQDAWVMRLDAEGMSGEDCQALLMQQEDQVASLFLGASDTLPLPGFNTSLDGHLAKVANSDAPASNAEASGKLFFPEDLQVARMCLAGLGELPPSNEPPPASGDFTLTVNIDGGPGIAVVYTGDISAPQFECQIDYQESTSCSTTYAAGTQVALYSDVASMMVLNWEGCTTTMDEFERPICGLTMDADQTVTAHLSPTHLLTLTINGEPMLGTSVYSNDTPTSVFCASPDTNGTTCFTEILEGEELLLSWNNSGGYPLAAWSGCTPEPNASNTATNCRLTMDTDHAVTATFGP